MVLKASGKFELALVFTAGFASALLLSFAAYPEVNAFKENGVCALGVTTVFSPDSQEQFVSIISSAEKTLDVMLYQFSNPEMKDALAFAVRRGVAVRIILEPRVDSNYATAEFLSQNGVSVRWASKEYTNTHSKTAVIDGRKVIVGSTNWSKQAMRSNRESTVLIEGEAIAKEFSRVFEEDWIKAKEYVSGVENATAG
ncbi:MAG: phospholipase D-like domain-containing protein [Candidatus Micrarchaeota archaeon]